MTTDEAIRDAVTELAILARGWVRRQDDAKRFPDVLLEQGEAIIKKHLSRVGELTDETSRAREIGKAIQRAKEESA